MKRILLEVIATTPEDARIAQEAGADRIEFISAQSEGGLTPSLGMVEQILSEVTIPVHAMIRPHSHSFVYTPQELQSMQRDIRHFVRAGVTALVLGVLDTKQQIDEKALALLLQAAQEGSNEVQITFHRAFDEAGDLRQSIATLGKYDAITRILTSGGKASALEATETFPQLIQLADQHSLSLIAGAGLTLETLETFVRKTEIREVHLGSAVRQQGCIHLPLDGERIRQARRILDKIVENTD